jgi:hypothetical protein
MEMAPEVDISRTCLTSAHTLLIWHNKLCIYVDWFLQERVAATTANNIGTYSCRVRNNLLFTLHVKKCCRVDGKYMYHY